MWILVLVIVVLLLTKWFLNRKDDTKLPPYVPGWPIIGSIFDLEGKRLHLQMTEWSKKYGNIFSMTLFGRLIVVVKGSKLVEKVMEKALDRSDLVKHQLLSGGMQDIIFGHVKSQQWNKMRKGTFKALKIYGNMLTDLETILQLQIEDLCDILKRTDSKPIDPYQPFQRTFTCLTATLMLGKNLGREHPDMEGMECIGKELNNVENFTVGLELELFPWLAKFNILTRKRLETFFKYRNEMLGRHIKDFKENVNHHVTNEGKGLIHLLMAEEYNFDEEEIKNTFVDFITGGTQTSILVTSLLVAQLLHHPDKMKKIQTELDENIGRTRSPALQDLSKLPYLKAAFFETLRYLPAGPLLFRLAHESFELGNFVFDKGTQFYLNMWSLARDKDFWKDPAKWRPERFLDEQGHLLPSSDPRRQRAAFTSFGSGKRVCPGNKFAETRVMMLIGSILQKFDMAKDPEHGLPDVKDESFQLINAIPEVKKYTMCFVPRA